MKVKAIYRKVLVWGFFILLGMFIQQFRLVHRERLAREAAANGSPLGTVAEDCDYIPARPGSDISYYISHRTGLFCADMTDIKSGPFAGWYGIELAGTEEDAIFRVKDTGIKWLLQQQLKYNVHQVR